MKRLITAVFLLSVLSAAFGENVRLEEAFRTLLDQALQLNIEARVLPPDQQPVWNMKSSKLTIPGRSVEVKILGNNLRIDLILTPYHEEDGKMLLLAQGQVWLSEAPEKETKLVSTFNSIPVSLGEKILFYPLGLDGKVTEQKTFTIQLEIQILPYQKLEEAPVVP